MLRKIIEEYNLKEILGEYFEQRDLGLFLDLLYIRSLQKTMQPSTIRIIHITIHFLQMG